MKKLYDFIIIGAGVIGISIARSLREKLPRASILIIDKEKDIAAHASSRNSGVLHAGFYYTEDSLKAKLTVAGNAAMKAYCKERHLPINECGKLVVAQNEEELTQLYELEKRGKANGSTVDIISEAEAKDIEPNIKTYKKALHSPLTASIDPKQVCESIKKDLEESGVEFSLETKYIGHSKNIVETNKGEVEGTHIINCAGLYADKIAKDFGFSKNYSILPFKGLYLKYTKNKTDVRTNIYPVPNLKNPFLGVHFTKTVTGEIKIGPTAIPAYWRENYHGFENFNLGELLNVTSHELKLMLTNSFNFRHLAFEEMRKYNKSHFINLAKEMVHEIDPKGFTEYTKPGIRAQLIDLKLNTLVQDFVVEGDQKSTHILNAVSPAFTCAFSFSEYVIEKFINP